MKVMFNPYNHLECTVSHTADFYRGTMQVMWTGNVKMTPQNRRQRFDEVGCKWRCGEKIARDEEKKTLNSVSIVNLN